jgi:hypothetical protein
VGLDPRVDRYFRTYDRKRFAVFSWSFLYAIAVFGISAGLPDWLDLRVQQAKLAAAGSPRLLPFLRQIGNANRYCFTRDGEIVEWDHERPEEPRPVGASFSELLMREIRDLEERLGRKLALAAGGEAPPENREGE